MTNDDTDQVHETVYEELDIGEEQVSSNECWDVDEDAGPDAINYGEPESPIHADLAPLHRRQPTHKALPPLGPTR